MPSESSDEDGARCRNCGETWPRDPRLEVPCPSCDAPVGSKCKRPSGHTVKTPHVPREEAALEADEIDKCACVIDSVPGESPRAADHETPGVATASGEPVTTTRQDTLDAFDGGESA